MKFTVAGAISAIRTGLELVQSLNPLAQAIGGPFIEKALNAVSVVDDIAKDLKKRLDDRNIVMSSDDEAFVKAALAKIEAEALALEKLVDAS